MKSLIFLASMFPFGSSFVVPNPSQLSLTSTKRLISQQEHQLSMTSNDESNIVDDHADSEQENDYDFSIASRDLLFDKVQYLDHDENAGVLPFLFSTKERLQMADKDGDFIDQNEGKLTHKHALVAKGVFYSNQNYSPVVEGILAKEKIPVIVEFATVGTDIAAPGLSISSLDKPHLSLLTHRFRIETN